MPAATASNASTSRTAVPPTGSTGFARATGDIFHFLNADDALLPGSLAYVASVFEANPRVDVPCGSGMKVDGDDRTLREIRASPLSLLRLAYGAANSSSKACSSAPAASAR